MYWILSIKCKSIHSNLLLYNFPIRGFLEHAVNTYAYVAMVLVQNHRKCNICLLLVQISEHFFHFFLFHRISSQECSRGCEGGQGLGTRRDNQCFPDPHPPPPAPPPVCLDGRQGDIMALHHPIPSQLHKRWAYITWLDLFRTSRKLCRHKVHKGGNTNAFKWCRDE
jgi:hypothetical protein